MQETAAATPAPNVGLIQAVLKLQSQHKAGAAWFYWIAGLSVINSLVIPAGSQWSFVIGLGTTQVVDAVAHQAAAPAGVVVKGIAMIINVMIAGVFVLFGYFAGRRHLWSYIVGMILYALDGLIFLLVKDFLSIGFHAFALVCIYGGLQASIKLAALEHAVPPPVPPPMQRNA